MLEEAGMQGLAVVYRYLDLAEYEAFQRASGQTE